MDYDTALTTLDIRLGDSDNFSFTPEEKQQAMTEAFNDGYVRKQVWDDSLTFAASTYQYPLPASITVIQDIYASPNDVSDEPESISSDLWEVVARNIQFKNNADWVLTVGGVVYLKGYYKYTVADTITETNVQEYVLNLAQRHCIKMLGVKKSLRFLKNDTTLAEVIALKHELDEEIRKYRNTLPRAWENG